ncbi:MAG TPA: hypothetical protein VF169_23755 [Albitalea sp.]|uniref:hypothetical protein n=1 Tax=Piscinibacter sp. TaxID=1903157 RepID=UPI002ED26D1F
MAARACRIRRPPPTQWSRATWQSASCPPPADVGCREACSRADADASPRLGMHRAPTESMLAGPGCARARHQRVRTRKGAAMNTSTLVPRLMLGGLAASAWLGAACALAAPLPPLAADVVLLRPLAVETPAIRTAPAPAVNLDVLPDGMRARLPAHDHGKILVVIAPQPEPPGGQTWAEVRAKVIDPLLRAVRFRRGHDALSSPGAEGMRRHPTGIAQPHAKLAGAADFLLAADHAGAEKGIGRATREAAAAFDGTQPPSADVRERLQMARGVGFEQFKADFEREEFIYPFLQVHDGVPIEHTLLLASRWAGQTVTSVRGTLLHRYTVANPKPRGAIDVTAGALIGLLKLRGFGGMAKFRVVQGPFLVLLPYGNAPDGGVALRHAWRVGAQAEVAGRSRSFLLWVDAEERLALADRPPRILKLQPLDAHAETDAAVGRVWRRDPGIGSMPQRHFDVDRASSPSPFMLRRAGLMERIQLFDQSTQQEVAVSGMTTNSTGSFVNFDDAAFNQGADAICRKGGNLAFQQIHLFAELHFNWTQANSLGMYQSFPKEVWSPVLESEGAGCRAWSGMAFGACQGYYDPSCPDYSTGGEERQNLMNFAHDSSIIGHEVGHNGVDRLTNERPDDWCDQPACPKPLGWSDLHDLADAWAAHFDDSNCVGGWVAKNLGGVNASYDCQGPRGHVEWDDLPRLHEVSFPFNPASPGDHFPDHRGPRAAQLIDYADGQIGAAALWHVREGMGSKDPASGHSHYFARFHHALKHTGFFGQDSTRSDWGIYRLLHDLEVEMLEQWATPLLAAGAPATGPSGDRTINKVLAGFAKIGIFPIAVECLDDSPVIATCPGGKSGAEAVIDIDDNDPADDLAAPGLLTPERDYLRLWGPAPTFHVWTGARYRFKDKQARPVVGTALCNSRFKVEVSTDEAFASGSVVESDWIEVGTNNEVTTAAPCFGQWTPGDSAWSKLRAGGAGTRLYYRVQTTNAAGGNPRVSTRPAAGLWWVPAPFAVITTSGKAEP